MAGGERLDLHLVRTGHAASRRAASELIKRGLVRVNQRLAKKGQLITADDRVEVERPPEEAPLKPNPEIPLVVLYEHQALLVVDKPGLMPCHPLRPAEHDTVMNAVVARYPEVAHIGDRPLEGGLVHRLDNGTSGALMVARDPRVFAHLRDAIRSGRVARHYTALLCGHLRCRLEMARPIAHHPRNPRKMVLARGGDTGRLAARIAFTLAEPVRQVGNFTVAQITPRTGVRHQIRVHLADAGFPLAGDILYGGCRLASLPEGRFFLHLSQIRLDLPGAEAVRVESPLPPDLEAALGEVSAVLSHRS